MRKCIVAILIVIFVVGICIYTTTFTSRFCKELENSIISCINEVENENWTEAQKHINSAIQLLNEQEGTLEIFVMHHDVDEIHSLVFKTSSAIRVKSKQICLTEAEYLLARIRLVSDADHPTIANIF